MQDQKGGQRKGKWADGEAYPEWRQERIDSLPLARARRQGEGSKLGKGKQVLCVACMLVRVAVCVRKRRKTCTRPWGATLYNIFTKKEIPYACVLAYTHVYTSPRECTRTHMFRLCGVCVCVCACAHLMLSTHTHRARI